MREVEDYDAKLTLLELLEAAKQGEMVVIMHGGHPVAHLFCWPHRIARCAGRQNPKVWRGGYKIGAG